MKQIHFEYWIKVKKQINGRSQRERVLLLLTGMTIIWVIMFNGFISPSSNEMNDNSEEIQNIEQEYRASAHELGLVKAKLQKQINAQPNSEVLQLQDTLKVQKEKLNHYREKLIKPETVPFLLDKLLGDFAGLTLVNVQTLPPKELKTNTLYRHGIRLTFSGEYKDLLAYVKKVESLQYPLWWDDVEYKITQFPKATIVLTLYTLSEHENWIGV
ncbi:MAG: type II secretion system protein M [Proteobacteria bacterium]|nr:type II secretion system protein M [Pseudomonadota bacterium]